MSANKGCTLKNIGVLVFKLKHKTNGFGSPSPAQKRKTQLSPHHKAALKALTYLIAFFIQLFKERKRFSLIETMFRGFMGKVSSFLMAENLSVLLKKIKFVLKEIFEAEDVSVTYYDPLCNPINIIEAQGTSEARLSSCEPFLHKP